jgi:enterochelin esterase family protein
VALSLFFLVLNASGTELQLKKTESGSFAAGKAQSYTLAMKAGDFAEANVDTRGIELIVTAYDPSGNKVRGFRLGPDNQIFHFVVGTGGEYRIDIAGSDKSKSGTFAITLNRIVSLGDRVASSDTRDLYESPRMKALHDAVKAGDRDAVAKFWTDAKTNGAPFIEPLAGDDKKMLVTFIWQGDDATQNVMVIWAPFSFQWPEDYMMIRLGQTDVWYKTLRIDRRERFIYRLAPNAPVMHASQVLPGGDLFSMLAASGQVDPFNPKHWLASPEDPDPPRYQGDSAVEMPDAPPQPWVAHRDGVPTGRVEKHQFASALLKNEREVAIYTPPGYSRSAQPYELVVLFDEKSYLNEIPAPTILDNLIAEKRIPPTVAILIDNVPGGRTRELTCNPTFADFLNFELVAWVRRSYNVTTDPRETVVGGLSLGGLAAGYAGLRHPETFGNVLSQSGSFWWTPSPSDKPDDLDPNAEPEWMTKQFIGSPRLPLRFYMDAGSDELDLSGHGSAILLPTRNLRDVLLAKGYEVHYQEFAGGHDFLSWRGTLADGLILLLGSPAPPRASVPAGGN